MQHTSGVPLVHLFETNQREKSSMKKHMVVIGCGITGVTSAYALVQQGFNVTLI